MKTVLSWGVTFLLVATASWLASFTITRFVAVDACVAVALKTAIAYAPAGKYDLGSTAAPWKCDDPVFQEAVASHKFVSAYCKDKAGTVKEIREFE